MTTDEIKVTAGILIDGMAFLAMLSMPVLNWCERSKYINKVYTQKPKTVSDNFYSITKQEILDQYEREYGDDGQSVKRFEKLIKQRGFRYFKYTNNGINYYGIGLKKWCDDEIIDLGFVFAFTIETKELFEKMYYTVESVILEQEK